MKLYENSPARDFDNAHLLGNGRLGASIYGGVPFEEILINDDTLWSGHERYRLNENYYDNLMKARALALSGDVKQANNIINEEMEGMWGEAYMPLASAHICVGQRDDRRSYGLRRVLSPDEYPFTGYSRTLDLDTAVETVKYTRFGIDYKREFFVSYPRQLICARLTAENGKLDFALTMDSRLKYSMGTDGGEIYVKGIAPDHAEPNYTPMRAPLVYHDEETSNALRFAARVRISDTDGRVFCDDSRIYVNDATYAVIVIAAGTNYAGYEQPRNNDVAAIFARLDGQLGAAGTWDAMLREHVEDYQALYNRVDINLGEDISGALPTTQRLHMNSNGIFDPSLAALAAQYGRYLLISGSRPGSQAENLQGIWNDRVQAPWSSNYTTNINVEMNYWSAEEFALGDCHEPMFDLISETAKSGVRTARDYYHLDGWVAHHNIDLWRMTVPACEDASWFFWPFGGAWMCQHLWMHYEYTHDKKFLRETAYPVIREAARFMLGYLCEDNGHLTTAPSTSPENKHLLPGGRTFRDLLNDVDPENRFSADMSEISTITKGSCMEMTMIRELFENVLNGAQALDIADDDTNAQMRAALPRLEPYKIGKLGTLQEWFEDYEECTPGMGHVSHLYSVYPANIINERDFPEEYRAAYLSLQRRVAHGGMTQAWPGSWALCLAARFHDRTLCTRVLTTLTDLFTANLLTRGHIQVDSIFGYAAGVGEMLMQSHNGYIELLPTPAFGWVEGSFRGLRARGGFECELKWAHNAITGGIVKSLNGESCAVKAEGLKGALMPDGEVILPGDDGIVRFATAAGTSYSLIF